MPGPFDGNWQFVFNKASGFLKPEDRTVRVTDTGSFALTFPLESGDLTLQVQSSTASFNVSLNEPTKRYGCVGVLVTSPLEASHIAGFLWRVRPTGDDPGVGEVEDTGSFTAIKQGSVEPSDSQG